LPLGSGHGCLFLWVVSALGFEIEPTIVESLAKDSHCTSNLIGAHGRRILPVTCRVVAIATCEGYRRQLDSTVGSFSVVEKDRCAARSGPKCLFRLVCHRYHLLYFLNGICDWTETRGRAPVRAERIQSLSFFRKLKYPSPATITWSSRGIPRSFPASLTRLVSSRSSALGSNRPDG